MLKQIESVFLVLHRRVAIAVALSLMTTLSYAQSIPATLGWYQIPNTTLRSVCPPNGFGGSGYPFTSSCPNVTAAWNSGVFDTQRNRLIVWGGGHADYPGNELYAVDLSTLSVQRLTDPGLPISGCTESLVGGTQPNSRHTYDGLAYMQNIDRLFVQGGYLYCGGGTAGQSKGTWTFDFATNTWQAMNPTGTIPNQNEGVISAYDPNTGKVFVHDLWYLYSYDFFTNAYTRHTSSVQGIDYHMTGVIDPIRKRFIAFGAGQSWFWDISETGSYNRQSFNTTGGSAIVNSIYPGLAYDPVSDRLVAWRSGDTVYSLNLDTHVWTSDTYSGGPTAMANGTYKRWSYSPTAGVFVVLNSVDSNAYTFRLSAASLPSTPSAPGGLLVQ